MDVVNVVLFVFVLVLVLVLLFWPLVPLFFSLICTRVAEDYEADQEIRHAVAGAPPRKLPENRRREEAECCSIFVYDTYTKERSAGEGEVGGGCAICLDEYADGERRATVAACNHRFHAVCIEAWVAEKKVNECSTCPLCRHDLV
ncbi:hypothetical protein C2S52_009907 [Perilla frutescens var. hirtella]|nr:hypothetical protein C2S52_009907 [Perilla frutescens var. hirtella]